MLRNIIHKPQFEAFKSICFNSRSSWIITFRPNVPLVGTKLKKGHTRTLLLSGTVGLLAFAVSDIQNAEQSHILSHLSSTGLCVTLERWSNASGGSSGVTMESVHAFTANRKSLALSTDSFQFSPTLKYTCFTIADSPETNGRVLTERVVDKLPFAVSLTLADAYSNADESNTSSPLSERNPGEFPNPIPCSSDIDSAIEEAFELVNETMYNDSRLTVNGPKGPAIGPVDGNTLEVSRHEWLTRTGPNISVVMGLFNQDDRSLRVVSTSNSHGHVIFGRRRVTTPPISPPASPTQVRYELEDLTPRPNGPVVLGTSKDSDGSTSTQLNATLVQQLYITERKNVQPGDFAVFCNAQLLNYLTKEEVTGLVGLWMQGNMNPGTSVNKERIVWGGDDFREVERNMDSDTAIGYQTAQLALSPEKKTYTLPELPLIPSFPSTISTEDTSEGTHKERRFVRQDDSVSLHLLRNVVGSRSGESQRNRLSSSSSSLLSSLSSSSSYSQSAEEKRQWAAQEKVISDTIEKEGDIGFTVLFF